MESKRELTMTNNSEKRSAKGAYSWLRFSPLLTIPTLIIVFIKIVSLGFYPDCRPLQDNCNPYLAEYIAGLIGVLCSALWHLVLLQYTNNKDSEFIRKHGRKALKYAAIRTAIVLIFIVLDFVTISNGTIVLWSIPILIVLWFLNSGPGYAEIDLEPGIETGNPIKDQLDQPFIPMEIALPDNDPRSRDEILDEILHGLQSDDDVAVLQAIMKISARRDSNRAILDKLEKLADEDENMDIRMDARVAFNLLKNPGTIERRQIPISKKTLRSKSNTSGNRSEKPEDIIKDILIDLKSDNIAQKLNAIKQLQTLSYSSNAIRYQLEDLALHDQSKNVRLESLAALDLPTNRNVRILNNKIDRGNRYLLLQEINDWVFLGFLEQQTAEVLRRRYDYDSRTAPSSKVPSVQPTKSERKDHTVKPVAAVPSVPMNVSPPLQMATSQPAAKKSTVAPKPAPKPVEPPKPKQPPIDWKKVRERVGDAATSGALLRALLYLGAFMIVISVTVLVVLFWKDFNPILQLLFISSVPLIFYAGGWALRTRLNLTQAGTVLTGTGAILVAVDFAAIYQLGGFASNINSSVYWFGVAIFCTALYAFTAWRMKGEFFDYLTLLAGAGVLFTLTSLLHQPFGWRVVSVTASAAIMTGISGYYWQAGERLRDLAHASRNLSQILTPASITFIVFSHASLQIMVAFLFATAAYSVLAWKFPSVVFAYCALGASIGTILFALNTAHLPSQWYGAVGSGLALAYILIGQLLKRAKIESNIIQSYMKVLHITGFILISLAAMDGLFLTIDRTTFWSGVVALAVSCLDLALCSYLFHRSRYTLLASGLSIIPFTLAIARWLIDTHYSQVLGWTTVCWGALALTYIGFGALLQKAGRHSRWLYGWAHVLMPFALFFNFIDFLTTKSWVNTPALLSLAVCISGYFVTFLLQDSGKHTILLKVSNWLPLGLGKAILLWPIGLLLPTFTEVAWYGTKLAHPWFGAVLAGFALIYFEAGQLLFNRAKEYRFPFHVFIYLLCFIAIPWASTDRYALLASLLITIVSAGILAYLYNRVIETVIASLLFIWLFQLLLEIFKIASYLQSLGYVLLASLAYIPIAIYINKVNMSGKQNHHRPIFIIGYALTVYALIVSLNESTSKVFIPWIGATVPMIATVLYIFSGSYFKSNKYGFAWAWVSSLTFAIAFGQALTLFKVPASYFALAWVGLAFAYMAIERSLSLAPETGKGNIERHWFDKFHWPLITGVLVLSALGVGLSLSNTFAAFTGIKLANYLPPILTQILLVILSFTAARLYRIRWPLYIEPFLAFLPATLFFIGYSVKIFHQHLAPSQFALVWTGLGAVHLLAAVIIDRAVVRYAHGLYLGAYALLTWAVFWSVLDRGTLVWSLGLWIIALVVSALLVHFSRHQTWDEFNHLIFRKSKGALQTIVHNVFQWPAAFAFPIWLTLFLRQIHIQSDFTWLGLVVPPLAYLGLTLWLRRLDSSYSAPLYSSAQIYTFIGLLISAPATFNYLAQMNNAAINDSQLGWICLQSIVVIFYAASARIFKTSSFAQASAWLSIIPFTVAWNIYGFKFTPNSLVIPWLIWTTLLLTVGFALDKVKVRYSHGLYLAGYALAIFALINSVPTRLTNIYALAITIILAVISHLAVHFGRHQSFENFVNKFWKKAPEVTQRVAATIFLFFASYAVPVLLAQSLTQLKLDLAVRGVALAIAAPLFIAIGLAVRNSKSRTITTVSTWPVYSAGYALTTIGAMISFGDERLAIYVLILNAIVYAASAYIFQQSFWLYLSTVLTPIIALLFLHNLHHLDANWVAWIFIGLAYLYLAIGELFDLTKKDGKNIHLFAAPFYAPGFLLSAIALAIASSDRILALQVYSAGVILYALAGWLIQEALFIYPASWLATVPYYLLITMTSLETRWYGLAWLPLIIFYIALGRFVFHNRPLPPLGKGVLVEWLSHPATPLYLLAYSLSVSMISLSYVSPLSLTLAFAAAAVIYFTSAYLFRAPSWIYAGLFATHMTLLAYFTIHPSGKPAYYITLPFLGMTWSTALVGYAFNSRITEKDSKPARGRAKVIKNETFTFSLLNHLFGHPWSRPFFAFAITEMFIWQTVAMKGLDTTIILGGGHALLFALFSILWAEGSLVYGVVGFGLLAVGAWMKQSGIPFNDAVAIYGGIGFGLYLIARIFEPISARIKPLNVWLTPLTYSAVTLTAASVIINLPFVGYHMTAVAASLAFAGVLYIAIAYRGRQYQLGYLGMALLEIAWGMALFMNDIHQPQWYAIPGGLYFMGLAYLEWQRNKSKYAIAIELLGLGILLITSFTQSLNGTKGFVYFVLLMVESLLIVWWGTIQKRKIPFFAGIVFSALNLIAQVIVMVRTYNISIWLVGLGMGLIIMTIAVFVELRREQLRSRTREWSETLEKWD
jgi:hypothetical protein